MAESSPNAAGGVRNLKPIVVRKVLSLNDVAYQCTYSRLLILSLSLIFPMQIS